MAITVTTTYTTNTNSADATHGLGQCGGVADVALDELKIGMPQNAHQGLAAVHKVVVHHHPVAGRQLASHHPGADVSGPSGNHYCGLSVTSCRQLLPA